LSGRAAEAIYNRFAALLDGTPTPERLGELNLDTLRTAGLSRPKASYLLDLAAKCVSGDLDIQNLHEHDDDGIIQQLTSVKGVGRWTSQMFLLFRLGRPDIFSELDLGMRKGVQKLYGLPELPSFQETAEFGARWAPHRSVASWYLWRSLE
jgi:3-methyladenine DNA glycosylase/8-oxoguanine DNA glycosylase